VWYLRVLAEASSSSNASSANDSSLIPPADPREDEDCLFLDVLVPEKIFAKAGDTGCAGAPVMVWIYGGGFTFGEKTNSGNPAGLILRSQELNGTGDGVIYVAINYRVCLHHMCGYPAF
jgi:carboxylesterase type B